MSDTHHGNKASSSVPMAAIPVPEDYPASGERQKKRRSVAAATTASKEIRSDRAPPPDADTRDAAEDMEQEEKEEGSTENEFHMNLRCETTEDEKGIQALKEAIEAQLQDVMKLEPDVSSDEMVAGLVVAVHIGLPVFPIGSTHFRDIRRFITEDYHYIIKTMEEKEAQKSQQNMKLEFIQPLIPSKNKLFYLVETNTVTCRADKSILSDFAAFLAGKRGSDLTSLTGTYMFYHRDSQLFFNRLFDKVASSNMTEVNKFIQEVNPAMHHFITKHIMLTPRTSLTEEGGDGGPVKKTRGGWTKLLTLQNIILLIFRASNSITRDWEATCNRHFIYLTGSVTKLVTVFAKVNDTQLALTVDNVFSWISHKFAWQSQKHKTITGSLYMQRPTFTAVLVTNFSDPVAMDVATIPDTPESLTYVRASNTLFKNFMTDNKRNKPMRNLSQLFVPMEY